VATSLAGVGTAREELSALAARGHAGLPALGRFSDCIDALLQRLFDDAPAAAGASAIVALGGYGRRQVFLQSDVDVLLLFEGPIGPA
jgi:UTP:GlnB (protein PII) uridylyltransferase